VERAYVVGHESRIERRAGAEGRVRTTPKSGEGKKYIVYVILLSSGITKKRGWKAKVL